MVIVMNKMDFNTLISNLDPQNLQPFSMKNDSFQVESDGLTNKKITQVLACIAFPGNDVDLNSLNTKKVVDIAEAYHSSYKRGLINRIKRWILSLFTQLYPRKGDHYFDYIKAKYADDKNYWIDFIKNNFVFDCRLILRYGDEAYKLFASLSKLQEESAYDKIIVTTLTSSQGVILNNSDGCLPKDLDIGALKNKKTLILFVCDDEGCLKRKNFHMTNDRPFEELRHKEHIRPMLYFINLKEQLALSCGVISKDIENVLTGKQT